MSRMRIWTWQTSTSSSLGLLIALILHGFALRGCHANLPPYFTDDMNNHVIPENTPVGTDVYTLRAVDPENSQLKYGIMGTDRLAVDERTGVVSVAKPIDREIPGGDRIKVTLSVVDGPFAGKPENFVTAMSTITISDINDRHPEFLNKSSYESIELIEDTKVGTLVLQIDLQDPDLTGITLSLNCTASVQSPEACEMFPIEVTEATAGVLKAEMRLGKKLDYNKRSLYQFILAASDGEHLSTAGVLIRIKDIQNTPPIFTGAMSGRIMEDAPVGSLVMVIQARDGDSGKPRDVKLSLTSNPGEVFQLDSKTGYLTTTRPLDRETLGSLLTIEVKAQEIPKSDEVSSQADIDVLQSSMNMTILIDDVNDFAPKFNKKEYITEINENTQIGTPLSDLNMIITDEDTGTFADFVLTIDGSLSDYFDIQPKFASGSVRPVIRVKKAFDFENPNERKFLVLVIAKNTDEPELFSTSTVVVNVVDSNDNRPKFEKEVYTLTVSESATPGSKIGTITAHDPDSKEYGNDGIVYQLVGSGNKKFSINSSTGEIFVAECPNINPNPNATILHNCLDYETQKTFDLLYMASDMFKMDGFIHSIVPLQIIILDSNDNPPYFDKEFTRIIQEDSKQFEPRFFIKAKDVDKTAVLSYRILEPAQTYFKIDENSAEILIKTKTLPPGVYSFLVEASDGTFKSVAPVNINVTDINNNHPAFTEETLENRVITIPEDMELGTIVMKVNATDADLAKNGIVHYAIDKGGYGVFEIDEDTGEIMLVKDLDNEIVPQYDLVVTAYDEGEPSMRTSTTLHLKVGDVYVPLPKIQPENQRAQVSESAAIGNVVTQITTNAEELHLKKEKLDLQFEFVEPIEARDVDNKVVRNIGLIKNWFSIDKYGSVIVAAELKREIITAVNFTIKVTSEKSKPGAMYFGSLMLTIFEVNDMPPKVEDMEVETFEELPPGTTILSMEAEDPEGGQISNYFIQQGSKYFSIDNKTGDIKVAGRLDYEEKPMYNLTVVAVDSGVPQLSSTATVMVQLININDQDPTFNQTEYLVDLDEHPAEGTLVTNVYAADLDGDVVSYGLESSEFSAAFRVDRLGGVYVTKEGTDLIDREALSTPYITLGLKAMDGQRTGYSSLKIFVKDTNDIWPHFEQKNYEIVIHAPLRAKQEIIKVSANGGDLPETEDMHYKIISGNLDDVFEVDPKDGIVRASQAYEKSGEFNIVVEITDRMDGQATDHYDRAGVAIKVLPGNFKKPEFLFPNKINSTLIARESDLNETEKFAQGDYTKVLGQLLAFDPDEGEAGKMSFYFKEGDELVTETDQFRVETESGRIFQIRPLDREEMNKYDLVVVAKDGGKPVSTQTQQVLTIEVEDIDDHKPRFEKRHYSFSIKENSLENTFIGQVKAIDEDDNKNAQIFYFLVSDEKNRYFNDDIRVDIKTGMIHSNAVLDRERIESYHLYIRASSSPLISKSSEIMNPEDYRDNLSIVSVNITIMDENDNGPHFPQKQYFAGINSDAEPGREILTFDSVDVDSSSPVQYSLIGANLILDEFKSGGSVVPSPFRIDPTSGRLTISSTAMRQYAGGNNRFLVKVGVKETIPPYHSDTTQIQVWVVESNQETVLTIKSPPKTMLKELLIDVLTNITSNLVLINKITPHVMEDLSVNKEWSDVYVTAVDKKSSQIVPVGQFLQTLDLGHDKLRKAESPIELYSAVPAVASKENEGEYFFNSRETFDTAFAGLIALVALLCMGLAAILAVCCCLNRMYGKDESEKHSNIMGHGMKYPLHPHGSIPGTPIISRQQGGDMIEDMATDNPLWIDHKLKTYEEQELTMQVASEQDNSNGSIDEEMSQQLSPPRPQSPQFSHAYATLHPHPTDYDNIHILGEDTVAVHL